MSVTPVVTHKKPATHPDITIYPGDLPVTWDLSILRNGAPMDLSTSTIWLPVTDDGVHVGDLSVDRTNDASGLLTVTLDSDVFDLLKRYSTWRLREATI